LLNKHYKLVYKVIFYLSKFIYKVYVRLVNKKLFIGYKFYYYISIEKLGIESSKLLLEVKKNNL
jgi:hypothetical protein